MKKGRINLILFHNTKPKNIAHGVGPVHKIEQAEVLWNVVSMEVVAEVRKPD